MPNPAEVDVKYKKDQEAKNITITISSGSPMSILDVIRALSSIMTQILTSGKY